jgi:hypothetical protein
MSSVCFCFLHTRCCLELSNSLLDAPTTNLVLPVQLAENTNATVLLTGQDVDAACCLQTVRFQITRVPLNGTLYLTSDLLTPLNNDDILPVCPAGCEVTYFPDLNFFGLDSFEFVALDDLNEPSAPREVQLRTANENSRPTVPGKLVRVDEDDQVVITLTASDVDGDSLELFLRRRPLFGELFLADGSGMPTGVQLLFDGDLIGNGTSGAVAVDVVYIPASDFAGVDDFYVYAADTLSLSDPARVLLTVNETEDAPTSEDTIVYVTEDQCELFSFDGFDIDQGQDASLQFVLIAPVPAGLRLVPSGADVVAGTLLPRSIYYCPPLNARTPETFVSVGFYAQDADGRNSTASSSTLSFYINPQNDAPVISTPNTNALQDVWTLVNLTATDPDVGTVQQCVISGCPPAPTEYINGPAPPIDFVFEITTVPNEDDGYLAVSSSATCSDNLVKIGEVLPFLLPDVYVCFRSRPDFLGTASFQVRAYDPLGALGASDTVDIEVVDWDRQPSVAGQEFFTTEDEVMQGTLEGIPVNDDDVIAIYVTSLPGAGRLYAGDDQLVEITTTEFNLLPYLNHFVWVPPPNSFGQGVSSFSFRAQVGMVSSGSSATALLSVYPRNE